MNTLSVNYTNETYRFPRDHALILRALLSHARQRGLPVAIERETFKGVVSAVSGYVRHLGPDTVRIARADGGESRIDLWRINRASAIPMTEAVAA